MKAPLEPPYCPECGYDLRGQSIDRCPECGFHYDRAALDDFAANASASHIAAHFDAVPVFVTALGLMLIGFEYRLRPFVAALILFLLPRTSSFARHWIVGDLQSAVSHGLLGPRFCSSGSVAWFIVTVAMAPFIFLLSMFGSFYLLLTASLVVIGTGWAFLGRQRGGRHLKASAVPWLPTAQGALVRRSYRMICALVAIDVIVWICLAGSISG